MTAADKETDAKIRQKIAYLQRLLTLRVRFMKYAVGVDVTREKDNIKIRWDMRREGEVFGYDVIDFEEIVFPASHLNSRIRHYKAKFRTEFKNRQ